MFVSLKIKIHLRLYYHKDLFVNCLHLFLGMISGSAGGPDNSGQGSVWSARLMDTGTSCLQINVP